MEGIIKVLQKLLKYSNGAPISTLLVLPSQPAITCSKLTIETVEQGVKYVQG